MPNQKDRLAESTKLKRDSEDLKLKLDGAGRDLDAKFVAVRRLEEESGQVSFYYSIQNSNTSPISQKV